jgi:large subunit ribosomal protein L10
MPSQKNIDQVAILKGQLDNAKAVILMDYSGLTVSEQTKLRRNIKESGGNFLVSKNRLFSLALKEKYPDVMDELTPSLSGTTAFLFAVEDEIAPLKALINFTKDKDLPKLKIGLMLKPSDRILSLEEITELSKLPTKNDLIAKLIGTLNAPSYRIVNALSGNLRKLVYVLEAINKTKGTN